MKDFEILVRNGPYGGRYPILKHKVCGQIVGYPANLSDAMKLYLGHECSKGIKIASASPQD